MAVLFFFVEKWNIMLIPAPLIYWLLQICEHPSEENRKIWLKMFEKQHVQQKSAAADIGSHEQMHQTTLISFLQDDYHTKSLRDMGLEL